MYWQPLCGKQNLTWSQPQYENARQQSVNDFVCCILCHRRAVPRRLSIIEVLVGFTDKIANVDIVSPDNDCQQSVNRASTERQQSITRASTEHQQCWVLHLVWFKGCATAFTHNQFIGSLCWQKGNRHGHSPNLKMSVNRASTILCVPTCVIQGLRYCIYP